jgi:hypothetical protein
LNRDGTSLRPGQQHEMIPFSAIHIEIMANTA